MLKNDPIWSACSGNLNCSPPKDATQGLIPKNNQIISFCKIDKKSKVVYLQYQQQLEINQYMPKPYNRVNLLKI